VQPWVWHSLFVVGKSGMARQIYPIVNTLHGKDDNDYSPNSFEAFTCRFVAFSIAIAVLAVG